MRILDLVSVSFKNLFRQRLRTFLTIVSMMVGAFLISVMMSVGNGLENFLVSQVTLFSNTRTIGVRKAVAVGEMMGFGDIEEYKEDKNVSNPVEVEDENDSDRTSIDSRSGDASLEERPDSEVSSEMELFMSDRKLGKEDLEKIREIKHVEDAQLEAVLIPEYITLVDVEDAKKLKVTFYGLSVGMMDDVNCVMVDENLLDEANFILLSDKYVEEWNVKREDLLGMEIVVNVALSVPPVANESRSDSNSEDFTLVVAGVVEKNIFGQIAMVSPDTINKLGAYRFQKELDDYKKEETAMEIVVVVDSEENVDKVDEEIEKMGYNSDTYEEGIGQIGIVFDIINYLLSSFGIIALVVASIGIANTLLMAIYERTREIGVMKAVGATRRTIGTMFTFEASLLGFLGGVLGLLVGWGFGQMANSILHNGLNIGNFNLISPILGDYPQYNVSVFDWSMVVLVMGVTTLVALFAGLYPAWRASTLNPIDALRHD